MALLKEHGICLVDLEEKIDTNSAAGGVVFRVFGAVAHFERRLMAERLKNGIIAALKLVSAGLLLSDPALAQSTVHREMSRVGPDPVLPS